MTTMINRYFLSCFCIPLFLLIHNTISAQDSAIAQRYPVIPYPTHLRPMDGAFTVNKTTTIYTDKLFTNTSKECYRRLAKN